MSLRPGFKLGLNKIKPAVFVRNTTIHGDDDDDKHQGSMHQLNDAIRNTLNIEHVNNDQDIAINNNSQISAMPIINIEQYKISNKTSNQLAIYNNSIAFENNDHPISFWNTKVCVWLYMFS